MNNNSELKITITLILCISQFLASCMSHQEKEVLECQEVLVSYVTMAGKSGQCEVDLCNTTVADLKEKIRIAGEFTGFFELLYNENILRDGNMLLKEIDNPSSLQNFTVVSTSNIQYLKSELGESNILGEEVWQALGVTVSDITDVSQEFVDTALKLKEQSYDPVVVLDIGMSIEELEFACMRIPLSVIKRGDSHNRRIMREPFYTKKSGENTPCWFIVPCVEQGVMPGGRMLDSEQLDQFVNNLARGWHVGFARELAVVSVLQFLKTQKILFGEETLGICREIFEGEPDDDHFAACRLALGNNALRRVGILKGLEVDLYTNLDYPDLGLFCVYAGCLRKGEENRTEIEVFHE